MLEHLAGHMPQYMAGQAIKHMAKDPATDVAQQLGEHVPESWAEQSLKHSAEQVAKHVAE
jgi:hypothetical protein